LVLKDTQLTNLQKDFDAWKDTCTKQAAILNAEKAHKDNVCGPFLTTIAEKEKEISDLKTGLPAVGGVTRESN
jgi:hypothetical protein